MRRTAPLSRPPLAAAGSRTWHGGAPEKLADKTGKTNFYKLADFVSAYK